jgi:hypothetical protein
MLVKSWITAQLVASQEALSSVELVKPLRDWQNTFALQALQVYVCSLERFASFQMNTVIHFKRRGETV